MLTHAKARARRPAEMASPRRSRIRICASGAHSRRRNRHDGVAASSAPGTRIKAATQMIEPKPRRRDAMSRRNEYCEAAGPMAIAARAPGNPNSATRTAVSARLKPLPHIRSRRILVRPSCRSHREQDALRAGRRQRRGQPVERARKIVAAKQPPAERVLESEQQQHRCRASSRAEAGPRCARHPVVDAVVEMLRRGFSDPGAECTAGKAAAPRSGSAFARSGHSRPGRRRRPGSC